MNVEFQQTPIKALEGVKASIREAAIRLMDKSKAYFQKYPELTEADGSEHSDGATDYRMAEVYLRTSEQIGTVLLQHKRDMVKAMDPYFSNLSEEEVDKIIKKYDEHGVFG